MSEWFHVGQKVIFIGPAYSSNRGYRDEHLPEVGKRYTVRALGKATKGKGAVCLLLDEVVNPIRVYTILGGAQTVLTEPWFEVRRFRPLLKRTTSIEVFQAMLVGPKLEVDA